VQETGAVAADRAQLEAIFDEALAAVQPALALAPSLAPVAGRPAIAGEPLAENSRLFVAAIGKAAAAMAREVERVGDLGARIERGLVVTKDGHGFDLERFRVLEAAHPVPDARGAAAGRALLELAAETEPADTLLVLLSGGASALTSTPAHGLSVKDLEQTNALLLRSGVEIDSLNALRKHLATLGGGGLARAARAGRIELLAISDVPGDCLDVIGSGPCTADESSWEDALRAAQQGDVFEKLPDAVRKVLERGARGELPETLKAGHPGLAAVRARVVASNADARRAALQAARARGFAAVDGEAAGVVLRGEARELGGALVGRARGCTSGHAKCLLVAGGETTVRVRGNGLGGRNQELALAAALTGEGREGWALLCAGTDGTDGPTDAAGAVVDGQTLAVARAHGLSPERALEDNDSSPLLDAAGALLRTGPTGTNVMDLALVLLDPARGEAAG
jgi:hydroxypyruvate reductase